MLTAKTQVFAPKPLWSCLPPVIFNKGFTVAADGEAVDLGLLSGLKWASFNIGANEPHECGSYFQCGGLKDVASFTIDNSIYHTGPDYFDGLMKYIPSIQAYMWSGADNPEKSPFFTIRTKSSTSDWAAYGACLQ